MGWTETARRKQDRSGLRYTSGCTDEEWAVIRPLFRQTSRVGRPRRHKARTLWNAIQYIATTGCQRAQLPKDFPPSTPVQYYFYRMRDNGLLDAINTVLIAWVRVSHPCQAVRLWRFCRAEARSRSRAHRSADDRDHQTLRPGGLCRSAAALSRRTHLRMAQSVPAPREGLGSLHRIV